MSTLPFPPYTYVPGRAPHPVNHPLGHAYGVTPEPVLALDPADPLSCPAYLRGVALFNAGYYWEAHEVWEALWHAAGRAGTLATFLKGLIKLAAAGVKRYEGRDHGVQRHAARAGELLRQVAADVAPTDLFAGQSVSVLVTMAAALSNALVSNGDEAPPVAGLVGHMTLRHSARL